MLASRCGSMAGLHCPQPVMSLPPTTERRILVIAASTREAGNAELLAQAALEGLGPGAEQRWLRPADLALPPFRDIRHAEGAGVYPAPEGDLATLLEATLWATDLVIATPLYWYSLPASLKLYLDHWSGFLRVPGLDFKARMAGKRMYVVCSHTCGDELELTQPLVQSLRYCADYLAMPWGGVVLGDGNRPGEVRQDTAALTAAAALLR